MHLFLNNIKHNFSTPGMVHVYTIVLSYCQNIDHHHIQVNEEIIILLHFTCGTCMYMYV